MNVVLCSGTVIALFISLIHLSFGEWRECGGFLIVGLLFLAVRLFIFMEQIIRILKEKR